MNNKTDMPEYVLTLFVSGASVNSIKAINNLQKMLEKYARGRYSLKVIDVHQEKALAEREQIIALPLLIKKLPLPERRLIGNMSDTRRVLDGIGLIVEEGI